MRRCASLTQPARALSAVLAALIAATSAVGLLAPRLYRDNALVAAGWLGNDLVTLLVATPVLTAALIRAEGGSARAQIVWLGALAYVFYNYAFYLFGAAFNACFLPYVAIVSGAGVALVFALASVDVDDMSADMAGGGSRGVAIFLWCVALGLGGFHLAVALASIVTGAPPAIVAATGHPTNVVAALDLPLVVVPSALAAAWLWRGDPWGYVLAGMVTVKGAMYMLALSAATWSAARQGALDDGSAIWLWGAIGVGSSAAAARLLGVPVFRMTPARRSR
jgi:hypothetical protein